MYKATVRPLMRHSVRRLNEGDDSLVLKMARPDFELAFPGDNSFRSFSTETSISTSIGRSSSSRSPGDG